MAIRDVNNHPSKSTVFHMETLVGKEAISSYVDNVVIILEDINPQVATIVKEGGIKFLNKSISTLMGLKSEVTKVELHDALKHRSDDLIKVITTLIEEIGSEEEIDLQLYSDETGRVAIINKYTGRVVWDKHKFNPKFTKILLKTIMEVLKVTKDRNTVREAFRCILSFSTVYKDIRGSLNFIISEEEKAIERLSSTVYTTNEEFETKLQQRGTLENEFFNFLKRFLQEDNSDDQLFDSITRNLRRTLERFKRKVGVKYQQYDPYRDSNFSFKSSGTTMKLKGKTKTVPAIIASAFEQDKLKDVPIIQKFDTALKFEGEYGFLMSKYIKTKYRPSLSIPQKKLARRIIHPGENARQDRLGYIHNLISEFMRLYNCDCTFNQYEGVRFSLRASGQVSKAVYCMDQSKATDTMLISAQKLTLAILLSQVFPNQPQKVNNIVEAWAYMVSGEENTFYMSNNNKVKYKMIVGQPQGYLSSFASFSLLNHFVMLFSLYKYYKRKGLTQVDARHLYRIVGDDSVVKLLDNDNNAEFRDIYIMCNKMINVEVNPEKGFSNFGKRTSTTAEFAKVLCVNGEFFTPTPFNIASSSANSTPENYLKYLVWLREKCNYVFKQDKIVKSLTDKFNMSREQLYGLDIILSTKTLNNDFYYLCNDDNEVGYNTELTNRLTWFNFMNQITKSLCKYAMSYSQNELVLGVESTGLAAEAMFKEIIFFKHLEKEFDVNQIPRNSKLYVEYSNDYVRKELFPILQENSTEDLVSIVQQSNILTEYMLEAFEQDLAKIGENLETINQIALDGPDELDEHSLKVIKEVTPLLCHRSWSLKNYQIDSNYLATIGKKLGSTYLSYSNEIFNTNFDTSMEETFNVPLDKTMEINLDLGLEFDF